MSTLQCLLIGLLVLAMIAFALLRRGKSPEPRGFDVLPTKPPRDPEDS